MQLRGTRVLLTGASGGLGEAIARELAACGATLVLSGRRSAVLQPLAQQLSADLVTADLADPAEVQRLAQAAGEIDVLVANAALPASGELPDYTPDQIDRSLDVNLRAPIMLARTLLPAMVARGRGHLVFVSSLAGLTALPGASLYSATKFGLRGFAHGLRQDLHGTGVGVSVVLPGFIRDAGMFADSGVTLPSGLRTKSPREVGLGVRRAIERNRAEVLVAPFELSLASLIGAVAPTMSAWVQRLASGPRITRLMAEGQRTKR